MTFQLPSSCLGFTFFTGACNSTTNHFANIGRQTSEGTKGTKATNVVSGILTQSLYI